MPRVSESIHFSLATGTVKTELIASTTPYKRFTFTKSFKGLQGVLENRTDAGCQELTGDRNAKMHFLSFLYKKHAHHWYENTPAEQVQPFVAKKLKNHLCLIHL